jgi:D-proline reductase (dithiol) PrdB
LGSLDEFSLPVRVFLKAYRWRRIDPVPWAPLRRPLAESRLALVTSAAFTLPDQEPFLDSKRAPGGDSSFREIPVDADLATLTESHRSGSFDHEGIHQDPNLGLPLDRARELVAAGRIGSLNGRHLSFMGSITAPGRLMRDSAPEAARRLAADGVDVALLVPV